MALPRDDRQPRHLARCKRPVKEYDALLANGDVDGERVWKGILRAVRELRRTERKDGERVN
jgi:hypothetical protein